MLNSSLPFGDSVFASKHSIAIRKVAMIGHPRSHWPSSAMRCQRLTMQGDWCVQRTQGFTLKFRLALNLGAHHRQELAMHGRSVGRSIHLELCRRCAKRHSNPVSAADQRGSPILALNSNGNMCFTFGVSGNDQQFHAQFVATYLATLAAEHMSHD